MDKGTPTSDYEKVRDFTIQAGQSCAEEPTAMTEDEVRFLLRMCLSELQELALTVTDNVPDSVAMLHDCMKTIDKSAHEKLNTPDEIIAAQADAIVDAWYYGCNAFAKKSVDISQIFNVVHQANMDKRDPKTKKFIKREDGKIIKPKGWKAPDIVSEVARQRAIVTRKKQLDQYTNAINATIPDNRETETTKRIACSTIKDFIDSNTELPTMNFETNKNGKCTVTFDWEDRLRYCIYWNGSTSILDIKKLQLLDRDCISQSSETGLIAQWLSEHTPKLGKAAKVTNAINLKDMKKSNK